MNRKYFNPNRRKNFFEKILIEVPTTNTFDLSFSNKLSFNMGDLVPLVNQEVYPGDKINISEMHLLKTAPLVTPVMHKCKLDLHTFFVPSRLLWENFETFQAYDSLNTIPEHPYLDAGNQGFHVGVDVGSLADYLGVPTTTTDLSTYPTDHPYRRLNIFPFAAYNKIFDDYYRDQNLQSETFEPATDGDNSASFISSKNPFVVGSLFKRAWEKDYFTSCLPFAQKGTEVVLPLGTTADIVFENSGDPAIVIDSDTGTPNTGGDLNVDPSGQFQSNLEDGTLDNSKDLKVDLSTATSASINTLRYAVRLQEFFERNARLGTRYIEQMLGKFGVRISDARAHRSQLIGSTRSYIQFSEVLQTSQTETTPLGQQGGHGMSVDQGSGLGNFFVEEHGFIMVIASVLPDTAYQQGIHKKFVKRDILDYYDPMFANLGEQEVKSWELYAEDNTTYNDTFGYQSRFAELKYNLSEVHGHFRDIHSDWHMGRIFSTPPVLNEDFVSADPTHRIFADTDPDAEKLYAYFHFSITAKRKIPFYSTPQLSGLGN